MLHKRPPSHYTSTYVLVPWNNQRAAHATHNCWKFQPEIIIAILLQVRYYKKCLYYNQVQCIVGKQHCMIQTILHQNIIVKSLPLISDRRYTVYVGMAQIKSNVIRRQKNPNSRNTTFQAHNTLSLSLAAPSLAVPMPTGLIHTFVSMHENSSTCNFRFSVSSYSSSSSLSSSS